MFAESKVEEEEEIYSIHTSNTCNYTTEKCTIQCELRDQDSYCCLPPGPQKQFIIQCRLLESRVDDRPR